MPYDPERNGELLPRPAIFGILSSNPVCTGQPACDHRKSDQLGYQRANESGSFSLKVSGKSSIILSFSYIGFDPKDIRTKGDTALLVTLVNSNKKMDDVVVIGYGTQKRSNILGAVATVDPREVLDLPVANLSTALVNQVPGVSINQSAGKPGASTSLTIRSPVSLNSQGVGPLYVIDGLAPIIGSGSGIDPTGKTAFDALDASEIESITFLKDGM